MRSEATTSQPGCSPVVSPSGINNTLSPRKPTTSAITEKVSRSDAMRQSSPRPTFGPSDSMMSPVTPVTRPSRRMDGAVRTWERRASMSGLTEAMVMEFRQRR